MKEPYLMKWLKTFPGKYGIELLFKSREAKILKPPVSLKSKQNSHLQKIC